MSIGAILLSFTTLTLTAALVLTPATAEADRCDCGQPFSDGPSAAATDCLAILNVAVGLRGCDPCPQSACDVNGDCVVSASDALLCLQCAIGICLPIPLPCQCANPPAKSACSGAEISALASSGLDAGWNGLGHDAAIIEGASVELAIVRRCGGDGDVCTYDADCPDGTCDFTCDCDRTDGINSSCELAGPADAARCVTNLHLQCESSADCPGGEACQRFFGPPLPLEAGGTPTCVTTYFTQDMSGTLDVSSGRVEVTALLRSRVHLGIDIPQPCPRCGAPGQVPELDIGDRFTCEGGPRNGRPCTVDAIHPTWGGVSSDCPPSTTANVSGVGLAVNLYRFTTDTIMEQATLPCGGFLGDQHPSTGNAVCLDDFSGCSSNADCRRCAGDLSACSSDTDCGADGPCQEAPDQPIACGVYCHCGYCSNDGGATADPTSPCFSDGDCDAAETCVAGPGDPIPHAQSNACANFICGLTAPETCCTEDDGDACIGSPTDPVGRCSVLDYIDCSSNADCGPEAGDCEFRPRPCFENKITLEGRASPLGSYCPVDDGNNCMCTIDADCAVGTCEGDTAKPRMVSLFCIPPTGAPSINVAGGIPGPGSLALDLRVRMCRCGNGELDCREECDDGNTVAGDGCDEACFVE